LQALYQREQNADVEPEAIRRFIRRRLHDDEATVRFAEELFQKTLSHRPEIDRRLAEIAQNWTIERMAAVDRNVLRLATCELLFVPDTPPKVAIDEAIELAKRFGTADSAAFVNGILDRLAAGRKGPDS
jgi:N utilization substance protein B